MSLKELFRPALEGVCRLPTARGALTALASNGRIPSGIAKRLPADDPVQLRVPGQEVLFRFSGPEHMRRQLQWRSTRIDEFETLTIWARLAKTAKVVVDVGANVGIVGVTAAIVSPTSTVLGFEPVPATAGMLRRNILLNGLGDRCIIREAAVSDHPGTVHLHIPEGADSLSSMASLHTGGFRDKRGEVIEVPSVTLDEECKQLGPVDLMKIDVEGFEDAVLRGAQRILSNDQPAVVFEVLKDGPTSAVEDCLRSAQYRFFHIRGSGLEAVERIVPDPAEVERNFLALPRGATIDL